MPLTLRDYCECQIEANRSISNGYTTKGIHLHDFYQIYMSMTDGLRFLVNDRMYEINRGDILLLSDFDLHETSVSSETVYDRFVINFSPYVLLTEKSEFASLLDCFSNKNTKHNHKLTLNEEEQEEFISLANALISEKKQSLYSTIGQRIELMKLLLFINRVRSSVPQASVTSHYNSHTQVRFVIEHINSNYEQAISLDELSTLCHLNKHYLCRLFRQETGFTIHDYILFRRLLHAIRLLREGYAVSATARFTGFQSDTYFITTFKKHLGITPYQYIQIWKKMVSSTDTENERTLIQKSTFLRNMSI